MQISYEFGDQNGALAGAHNQRHDADLDVDIAGDVQGTQDAEMRCRIQQRHVFPPRSDGIESLERPGRCGLHDERQRRGSKIFTQLSPIVARIC